MLKASEKGEKYRKERRNDMGNVKVTGDGDSGRGCYMCLGCGGMFDREIDHNCEGGGGCEGIGEVIVSDEGGMEGIALVLGRIEGEIARIREMIGRERGSLSEEVANEAILAYGEGEKFRELLESELYKDGSPFQRSQGRIWAVFDRIVKEILKERSER